MVVTLPLPQAILAKLVEPNTDRQTQLIVEIFGTLNLRFKELNSLSYRRRGPIVSATDAACTNIGR